MRSPEYSQGESSFYNTSVSRERNVHSRIWRDYAHRGQRCLGLQDTRVLRGEGSPTVSTDHPEWRSGNPMQRCMTWLFLAPNPKSSAPAEIG